MNACAFDSVNQLSELIQRQTNRKTRKVNRIIDSAKSEGVRLKERYKVSSVDCNSVEERTEEIVQFNSVN